MSSFCCCFFLLKKEYTSDTTWSLIADFAVMLATLLFKHFVPHYCLFFLTPCSSLLHQHCLFDDILRWAYHSYRPLWIVCCRNILFHAVTSAFSSDPLLNRFCFVWLHTAMGVSFSLPIVSCMHAPPPLSETWYSGGCAAQPCCAV